MGASGQGTTPTLLRVRMVAQPASVPATRRFVDDALTEWGRKELIDDVGLCVSELSTNATLHSGSRFFEVELEDLSHAVRVAVVDWGARRLDAADPTDAMADPVEETSAEDTLTTGRGLFIVSAVADAWGSDEMPDGNRVWAEVASPDGVYESTPPHLGRTEEPSDTVSSSDWTVVTLAGCPVELCLAHDDNLAEMMRELQLISSSPAEGWSEPLAALMSRLVERHSVTWNAGRLIARDAVQAGQEYADIDVVAPRRGVADDIRALQAALRKADELSVAGELITLPAGPEVQLAREWMAGEFIEQTENDRAPLDYRTWLTQRGR